MSENWTWRDEFERVVESYAHDFVKKNKPTNINDLLDLFNKVVPPASQGSFGDLVDDPTAATPPPQKETPMAKNSLTSEVYLFMCPACKESVSGTASVKLELTNISEDLHSPAELTYKGDVTGVHVLHDCLPKVTR